MSAPRLDWLMREKSKRLRRPTAALNVKEGQATLRMATASLPLPSTPDRPVRLIRYAALPEGYELFGPYQLTSQFGHRRPVEERCDREFNAESFQNARHHINCH